MDLGSAAHRSKPLLDESPMDQSEGSSLEAQVVPRSSQKPFNWKAPAIIMGFEFLESIAYSGVALNLIVYLGSVLHGSNASNAAHVDAWNGTTFFAPVIGAVLADTYWGKYKTIRISVIFYLLGMLTLTASTIIPSLKPASCTGSSCPPASGSQYLVFFIAIYLIAIGTGGVKSALLPFGGDQYDETNPEESLKKQYFFSWFFIAINLGVFISGILIVWIQQNVSWALGFGVATSCLAIAVIGFFVGTPMYRINLPTGSPLKDVMMVFVCSFKKMKMQVPEDSCLLYEEDDEDTGNSWKHKLAHTDGLRFLDKAAVVPEDVRVVGSKKPWLVCTITQVEEVKILIRMLPIWFTSVLYAACMCQTNTTFVQQGTAMNTMVGSIKVPAASLSSIEVIFMMFFVVLQDKVVLPIARSYFRNTTGLSQLQRMGVGRFLIIFSLAAAALTERQRLKSVKAGHNISIAWQLPQFLILAWSDVFCGIAQLEFFYSEAPESLRSMCSAFSFLALSLGFYVNSLVITFVASVTKKGGSPGWIPADLNDGHLDYYFWLWTGISVINFVVYVAFASNYKLKKIILPRH